MKKYIKRRAVKFNLERGQPKLDKFMKLNKEKVTATNNFVYDLIRKGVLDIAKSRGGYWKIVGEEETKSHAQMKKSNFKGFGDFIENTFKDYQAKYWRGVVEYVFDRYNSFEGRNRRDIKNSRKYINKITIKGKEVQLKNQLVSLDESKCELNIISHLRRSERVPTGQPPLTVKYRKDDSYLRYIDGLGSSKCDLFGGNIIVAQRVLVACCNVEETFAYDPVGAFGFDLNKTPADFIHVSDPIDGKLIFPKPDTGEKNLSNLTHVEKVMKYNNDLLHSRFRGVKGKVLKTGARPFNHKKANSLRKKNKTLHRHQTRLCHNFIDVIGILDHVEKNKLLLCIDSVGSGQQNGSFAQDKIIPYLVKMCENRGIPFIIPPVRYTSQRCPSCNHVSKSNRKNTAEFECTSCGHKENSHAVGAKNVKRTGWWLWENHFEENRGSCDFTGNKWLGLITKHFLPPIPCPAPPPIGKSALKQRKTLSIANKRRVRRSQAPNASNKSTNS